MKNIIILLCILHLLSFNTSANYYYNYKLPTKIEKKFLSFGFQKCQNIKQEDIPTIFVPGTLSSWYSEEGFKKSKTKKWVIDPITHIHDTLFYTFKKNGYSIKDVFYNGEYDLQIKGNPKQTLYLFGYDWKKDNKITATLLNDLISKIRTKYYELNNCDIGQVNLISHSMGGLVVRAMLEDMCVGEKELNIYKNNKVVTGKITKFTSIPCKDQTKINKFISISAPHRGSPKSIPLWEKGNINRVENFFTAWPMSLQFGDLSDKQFYQTIHGYNPKLNNGIISMGQTLPDIKNNNKFNDKLKYLYKKDFVIQNNNYPVNSFLEELNKQNNIDKMWPKIINKYTSYYSIITQNHNKNNIVGYNLLSYIYTTAMGNEIKHSPGKKELTNKTNGSDIYDYYPKEFNPYKYNIISSLRNQSGYGGDGTVPTNNLLLTSNNTNKVKEIQNPKFESLELKCYGNYFPKDINDLKKYSSIDNINKLNDNHYSPIYSGIGNSSIYELCSHSNTSIALSLQILTKLTGNNDLLTDEKGDYQVFIERQKLLQNLGYADYSIYKTENGGSITSKTGRSNLIKVDNYFNELNYNKLVSKQKLEENFTKKPISVPLDFIGKLGLFDRVFIRYEVLSPINLIITDSLGRKIGIDQDTGNIINEIPGAWTSGNTDTSKEKEIFLIPYSSSGNIIHNIKTYATGDGEYHIEAQKIDLKEKNNGNKINKKLVIAGNAKIAFGDDYKVILNKENTFENLTDNIPLSLEINNKQIITRDNLIKIKYIIRGKNNKNVFNIKSVLKYNGEKIKESKIELNGNIDLDLQKNGDYTLNLFLLDFNGDIIKNKKSQVQINIKKIEKYIDLGSGSNKNKSFLDIKNINIYSNDKFIKSKYFDNILNFEIYKNNKFNSDIGLGFNHNFFAKFYINNFSKDIEVLLPNGKENIFEYKNFQYKSKFNNNLELIEKNNFIHIFDKEFKQTYIFDKQNFFLLNILSQNNKIDFYYSNIGLLNYISDNKTNSYFFEYNNDNLINKINDIYGNQIEFNYIDYNSKKVLTNINYKNIYETNGNNLIEQSINIGINLQNEFEIIGNNNKLKLNNKLFNNLIYSSQKKLFNNKNFKINYFETNDKQLYSFLGKNIYKITNNNKKLLLKNNKIIKSIFVSEKNILYFYDGEFKYLSKNNKIINIGKKILLNNYNFVVKNNNIYFLDKFSKGYYYLNLNTFYIYKIKTSSYYNYIYLYNNKLFFNKIGTDLFGKIEENLEFDKKYELKLQNLKNKINYFDQKQIKLLKKSLVNYKNNLSKNINNDYLQIEIFYLINKIEDFIVNV